MQIKEKIKRTVTLFPHLHRMNYEKPNGTAKGGAAAVQNTSYYFEGAYFYVWITWY